MKEIYSINIESNDKLEIHQKELQPSLYANASKGNCSLVYMEMHK